MQQEQLTEGPVPAPLDGEAGSPDDTARMPLVPPIPPPGPSFRSRAGHFFDLQSLRSAWVSRVGRLARSRTVSRVLTPASRALSPRQWGWVGGGLLALILLAVLVLSFAGHGQTRSSSSSAPSVVPPRPASPPLMVIPPPTSAPPPTSRPPTLVQPPKSAAAAHPPTPAAATASLHSTPGCPAPLGAAPGDQPPRHHSQRDSGPCASQPRAGHLPR